jgi:hypothetical protein
MDSTNIVIPAEAGIQSNNLKLALIDNKAPQWENTYEY